MVKEVQGSQVSLMFASCESHFMAKTAEWSILNGFDLEKINRSGSDPQEKFVSGLKSGFFHHIQTYKDF